MGRFQTFDWIIDKDEALYFFRVINITNALGSRFAVAKTANDDTTRLKLAVEYDNLETLETFQERVCNRMTFENWQHLSDRHFLYESWLLIPNTHQPSTFAEIRILLCDVANCDFGFGFLPKPDAFLFPYNSMYHAEIGRLDELADLRDILVEAYIPTIDELKSLINQFLVEDERVTYFNENSYWDAKVVMQKGTMFIEVMRNEDDNYILFGLRGDWIAVVFVVQQLANTFGSMVIDVMRSDWQSIVINPNIS